MSLLDKLNGTETQGKVDTVEGLSSRLSSLTTDRFHQPDLAKSVIATENFDDQTVNSLRVAANDITHELDNLLLESGEAAFENYQKDSARIAGIYSNDPKSFYGSALRPMTSGDVELNQGSSKLGLKRDKVSLESYSDENIRTNRKYSVIYNLLATKQDDFGNAFFPVINLDSMETGIEMSVNVSLVYRDFVRALSGVTAAFNRQNTLRAYRKPEVLEQTHTRIWPVVRTEGSGKNVDMFVDAADVKHGVEDIGAGISVPTAPLKMGLKEFDLIGISQRDEMLNAGMANHTDTLGPSVRLQDIFVKIGGTTVKINVYNTTNSIFTATKIGDSLKLNLAFDTTSLIIKQGVKDANGDVIANATIADNNIRLGVSITGTVFLDQAKLNVNSTALTFISATDKEGKPVTKAVHDDIQALVDDAEVIGHITEAFFSNDNLRQQGQLVESKTFLLTVPVPFQSPMSVYASTFRKEDLDGQVAELISLTAVRMSNQAVARIEQASNALRNYVKIADSEGSYPEIDPIGSYYLIPYHYEDEISINQILDGTASANRKEDIEGALIQIVLRQALDMVEQSEYTQAGIKLTGNPGFKPKVIIGTSVKIATYLPEKFSYGAFDFEVVTSLNEGLDNKLYMSFQNTKSTDGARKPDPLNFGNLIWAPELISNMPRTLRGQTSQMLTVMPRWLHIWNCPALVDLTITDLEKVAEKVTYFTKEQ